MICCFSGSNCTGKTTLVNKLGEILHIDTDIESAREIDSAFNLQGKNLDRTQLALFVNDLNKLIQAKNSKKIYLFDRGMLDVIVFNKYFWKNKMISNEVYRHITNIASDCLKYIDIIFYIEPEFPMISDNFRITNKKFQNDLTTLYRQIIRRKKLNVIKISGSVENRVTQVLSKIVDSLPYLKYN